MITIQFPQYPGRSTRILSVHDSTPRAELSAIECVPGLRIIGWPTFRWIAVNTEWATTDKQLRVEDVTGFRLASDLANNTTRARCWHLDVVSVARQPNKAISSCHVSLTQQDFPEEAYELNNWPL